MSPPNIRPVHVASQRAVFDWRDNGVTYVRSTEPLAAYPAKVTDRLEFWAREAPERTFLAQRAADGSWQTVTYGDAWVRVRNLASGLLELGMSPATPLIILSGNSIEHGLLALAAMHVGIPYAPVAPSYSLAVCEFKALDHLWQNLNPSAVFVEDGQRFTKALEAVMKKPIHVFHHGSKPQGIASMPLTELEARGTSGKTDEANCQVGPDAIAKILYTSGSTGLPKGVITTHRMLCCNQQMLKQVMPCLSERPVICDWLPWNHTFGGSHNFGIVLYNGGSLYIDAGRPTEEKFGETVRNLREIAPTAYFNVPKGYEMLVGYLRTDSQLRETFFSRLNLIFCAAAGLGQFVRDELQKLAVETCGQEILAVTGLGATESAPFAISTGIEGSASGHIGLPVPGVELKLVPIGERTEVRLRGPSITPGFWRRPDLDAAAFDDENYYRMGDAVKFIDPKDPQKGLLFDGRLNEDFKLSSGTWVRAGSLRTRLLAHFNGLLQDIVLAGPDRDYVVALLFPATGRCRELCPDMPSNAPLADVLARVEVRAVFQNLLETFARVNSGNSTRVARAILSSSVPSMEAQEITDKGTLNQAAVWKNRAAQLELLYQKSAPADVIEVR